MLLLLGLLHGVLELFGLLLGLCVALGSCVLVGVDNGLVLVRRLFGITVFSPVKSDGASPFLYM